MKEESKTKETAASRVLAPEDVRAGEYVCLHKVVYEFPGFLLCCGEEWKQKDVAQCSLLPSAGGIPMRVVEVCIPYILVETHEGKHQTLDLRRQQVARVSRRYGARAFKKLKQKV